MASGSAHVVNPITEPALISDVRRKLEDANRFLSYQAALAMQDYPEMNEPLRWGIGLKRLRVPLPTVGRPELIPLDIFDHPLVEMINQTATMTRLIDSLEWAEMALHGWTVKGVTLRKSTCFRVQKPSSPTPDRDVPISVGSIAVGVR